MIERLELIAKFDAVYENICQYGKFLSREKQSILWSKFFDACYKQGINPARYY